MLSILGQTLSTLVRTHHRRRYAVLCLPMQRHGPSQLTGCGAISYLSNLLAHPLTARHDFPENSVSRERRRFCATLRCADRWPSWWVLAARRSLLTPALMFRYSVSALSTGSRGSDMRMRHPSGDDPAYQLRADRQRTDARGLAHGTVAHAGRPMLGASGPRLSEVCSVDAWSDHRTSPAIEGESEGCGLDTMDTTGAAQRRQQRRSGLEGAWHGGDREVCGRKRWKRRHDL